MGVPNSEVGYIPAMPRREDHEVHKRTCGLGRLVEFRFKVPPGTTSSSITTHTPSGQRNYASWASQHQKSVTLLPCPGGRTTTSTKTCGLGRLVEFRFKAPPGTTSSSITTYTSSGQRNYDSWASQPQKSVTLLPCPGGRTTKSTKDMWWHLGGGAIYV